MRSFAAIAFLFTTVAACGGHLDIDPNPDSGPTCPNNALGACSDNGAKCSIQMNECGQTATEQCTCMNGSWACPIYECPHETCPVNPAEGASCFTNGMSCPSNVVTTCSDVPVTCTCNGSHFECPIPDCPPPFCPPPDQIVAGQACNGPGNMLCTNGDGSGCFCQGTWQCEGIVIDGGAPDAGSSD